MGEGPHWLLPLQGLHTSWQKISRATGFSVHQEFIPALIQLLTRKYSGCAVWFGPFVVSLRGLSWASLCHVKYLSALVLMPLRCLKKKRNIFGYFSFISCALFYVPSAFLLLFTIQLSVCQYLFGKKKKNGGPNNFPLEPQRITESKEKPPTVLITIKLHS